jgi:hypothetical protein
VAAGVIGADLRGVGMADFGVSGFVVDLMGSFPDLPPAGLAVTYGEDWPRVAGTFAIASDAVTAKSQETRCFIR